MNYETASLCIEAAKTCILCVALCGFPQSLNTDGKFEEAEGEYLEWPKFGDFPANNPKRRRGYNCSTMKRSDCDQTVWLLQ